MGAEGVARLDVLTTTCRGDDGLRFVVRGDLPWWEHGVAQYRRNESEGTSDTSQENPQAPNGKELRDFRKWGFSPPAGDPMVSAMAIETPKRPSVQNNAILITSKIMTGRSTWRHPVQCGLGHIGNGSPLDQRRGRAIQMFSGYSNLEWFSTGQTLFVKSHSR